MIIKPPLKTDTLVAKFNGNYDIEEKSKYAFSPSIKKMDVTIGEGDLNKIINTIIKYYNISTITELIVKYKETKDISINHNSNAVINKITIKQDYADRVEVIAKGININFGKNYIGKLKVECNKLSIKILPFESLEATCKSISVNVKGERNSCNFTNITASSFNFTQVVGDVDATYKLTFDNCNIKNYKAWMGIYNYDIKINNSNIKKWNMTTNNSKLAFTVNESNNITFVLTLYKDSHLIFDGNSNYTVTKSIYAAFPSTIEHKDNVIIDDALIAANDVTLINMDFKEKTNKSLQNVLLGDFDKEYEGDDFLDVLHDSIKQYKYISVANAAKAAKLIKSKATMNEVYNLTHIYTSKFRNNKISNIDGTNRLYDADEIIKVFEYASSHGILGELLRTHSKHIYTILQDTKVSKLIVEKCHELGVDIPNIFIISDIILKKLHTDSLRLSTRIIDYCGAVENKGYVLNDFDNISHEDRLIMVKSISQSKLIEVSKWVRYAEYMFIQLRIHMSTVREAYEKGLINNELYYIVILTIWDLDPEEKINTLMGLSISKLKHEYFTDLNYLPNNKELNNKLCVLKVAVGDKKAIEIFFDTKAYMSDAYNNYKYKRGVNETILSDFSALKILDQLNNTEINKIMGYDPKKYADLNYGSRIVNQLLLMERRKIKNNIIYRKLPRNTNTIYLDTVNELKSSYNKNSDEYAELKWIENNIDINGASGSDLDKIDEYLIDNYKSSEDSNKESIYKLLTNNKKSYLEEKDYVIEFQSLIQEQKVLRMNLKNISELNLLLNQGEQHRTKHYIETTTGHPVNKSHLTLVWLRFNVDEANKSIWVNETQTDMTKILDFGEYNGIVFVPSELGNKLNDRLAYLIIYQFQFWVVKNYPNYTVVLPSYTTRKKLIGGDPTVNGYDNPAKKLKFTKGEYKDTPWYNVKKGNGLVWIWSPLTEEKQI